jgi:hypothetical protein
MTQSGNKGPSQQQSGSGNTQNMTINYGQPNNCNDEIEKAEKFLAPECAEQMISQIKDSRNQQQKTYYDKGVQDIVGAMTKKFAPIIKNHPNGDRFIGIRDAATEAITRFAYKCDDKEELKSAFATCLEQIREIKNTRRSFN